MMHASPLRTVAAAAVGILLIAAITAVAPPAAVPAAAAPLPAGAETFDVSGDHAGASTDPFMTADAQHVVYTSTATDLVAGDTNGVADIFLESATQGSDDPFSGAPVLVSAPDGPVGATRANAASDDAVSSIDGRIVAFTSAATNLTADAGTGDGRTYIYVRDTVQNKTIRIQGTAEPDGSSRAPDLSDDGRRLVFTSDATNLGQPGEDANGATDSFIVDLDANGDGTIGDLALRRISTLDDQANGTHDAVISGNGDDVAVMADSIDDSGTAQVILLPQSPSENASYLVGEGAVGRPSIDATGRTLAYVRTGICNAATTIVAVAHPGNYQQSIALGMLGVDWRSGSVADPQISPDGSTVAWTSTVPLFDSANGGNPPAPELSEPVVRVQDVPWGDSSPTRDVPCSGSIPLEWYDVAAGSHASISASGRTVALQSAASGIVAVDRHSTDGLSVTSTLGVLGSPPALSDVPISSIPLDSLRDFAGALAGAPIHRLPIHRLPIHRLPIHRLPIHRLLVDDSPIHRLPIHRLPIHRLPIHRLDLPGGWDQVLEGTPFAGELIQTVTLDDVLTWAEANPDTDAGRIILSLTLDDFDIDGTGLDSLSLASYVLGSTPVARIDLGGAETPTEQWQRLAEQQGLGVTVVADTYLADLDAAGIDIAGSGIDEVALRGLVVDDDTLFGFLLVSDLFLAGTPLGAIDVARLTPTARVALFGADAVSGTLAAPSMPLSQTATVASLAAGLPADVTLGTMLFSLLDAESYPWEQLAAGAIDPRLDAVPYLSDACAQGQRCGWSAAFRFVFDVGPGEPTDFAAPTATVTVTAGSVPISLSASGTGPGTTWIDAQPYSGPARIQGSRVAVPLPDTRAGTVFALDVAASVAAFVGQPEADATLASGTRTASSSLFGYRSLSNWDNTANNWSPQTGWPYGEGTVGRLAEGRLYFEWISPAYLDNDDFTGAPIQGPAGDEDYYRVAAPPPGKRLVVSTNAMDGQISLSLYRASASGTSAASLGLASAGPAPGTVVTEQSNAAGAPADTGADAGAVLPTQSLIDQTVQRGDATTEVVAASTDAAPDEDLLIRVASGDGRPSAQLYSLRIQYLDEPADTTCPAWTGAFPATPGAVIASDPVTAETNTLYLLDAGRYDATYGPGSAQRVADALHTLTGTGDVGATTVQGAVLSIDADADVRAARTTLDANPCSMTARAELVSAVNRYVAAAVGDNRSAIRSVVVVGGDDIVPLAPVAQHTSQFTEESHAADLRLAQTPAGAECPVDLAAGTADPCATPLSAAAAASMILSDDPYGLASAYESLGGYLYVPTVALGRLAGSPDAAVDAATRFVSANGVLAADSSLTGGYGAWSELPAEVTDALAWRSPTNAELGATNSDGLWDAADVTDALFPAAGSGPAVVSINTHADESRMLPGIADAEDGRFADSDLFTAAAAEPDAGSLAGSIVFLIGCHAGNELPASYYGADAADWVDVFSHAGGYVGNTGYGLANDVTTALGERLLALYADWIGVRAGGVKVSAAQALTYAKQSYLGGLGLYSGYDEKALMEAVYYGLPMYTFTDAATTKDAPVPAIPASLQPLQSNAGISTASLTLAPSFQKRTVQDAAGDDVSYLVADGQAPAVVAGQPVLPKVVSQLPAQPGLTPRGALITGLTSVRETGVTPAIATPSVGVDETAPNRTGAAFPSSFATISRQQTPAGAMDLLVVTPGRVEAPAGSTAGAGMLERFTNLGLDVLYGDTTLSDDAAPAISQVETSGGSIIAHADGTGSAVQRAVLLVDVDGDDDWQSIPVQLFPASGTVKAYVEADGRPFRWILQVADAAGNVGVETGRGQLIPASASAPTIGDTGGDAELGAGDLLTRSVPIEGVTSSKGLTGSLKITDDATATGDDATGIVVATATVPVVTAPDGTTRAKISQLFATPGDYTVALQVCAGGECTDRSLAVHVSESSTPPPVPNTPPTATVTLTADRDPIVPTAVLTASATGSDADGDTVTLAYAWSRNGEPIAGQDGAQLSLSATGAAAGDVVRVTVTPSDPSGAGTAAYAELTVAAAPPPPPPPGITAAASNAAGVYVAGTWSTSPVTVTFTCTPATNKCPKPVTTKAETSAKGVVVTGSVKISNKQTATVSVLVKIDKTAPRLAPKVTPAKVVKGEPATAAPNATDSASGIATQSCDTPQTSTLGAASVVCRATDNAGNTASAVATYTVVGAVTKTCKGVPDRTAQIPLEPDGSSVFLRTSGVPITFRACDANGKPIGTKNFVKSVTQVSSTALPNNAKVNELWYVPITGFTYVKAADAWLGQISTVSLAGGKKYTYKVLLADGTSFTFTFGVK